MTAAPGSSGPATGRRPVRRSAGSPLWRRASVVAPVLLLATGCGGAPATTAAGGHDLTPSQQAGVGTPTLPPWVTKPSLPPCPPAAPTPRAQLPAVSLSCLAGGRGLSLDRLPARPFVVNLWASWCEPCRREAPRLAAAAKAAAGHVEFLGVDTQDGGSPALAFLHDFGIDYPQLTDPGSDLLHRLPAPGIPVTLAVNAAGQVVYRRIGEISAAQLADAVHAADPTAPVPAGGGGQ